MASGANISEDELVQRVIPAFLKPVVRLAARFKVPIRTVTDLAGLAYSQELREAGVTLHELSERLQISRRTSARLPASLRDRFVGPDVEGDLPSRIEFMLAVQPMSARRIRQVLRFDGDAIDAAIESLVDEGRIRLIQRRTPVYQVVPVEAPCPRKGWLRRIGALTSLAANLGDVAHARFFADEPRAFARTLTLCVPRGGERVLEEMFNSKAYPTIEVLSDRVNDGQADDGQLQLSIYWAPLEFLRAQLAKREVA